MNGDSVVFIAFEKHENLGIRYMAAVLSEAGYEVEIIDFRKDKADIAEELIKQVPLLVGFSIIFEECISDFKDLIGYLRNNGIQTHITAGGHFASLRPSELFDIIPSLDSIVRFEGEHTLLDLVNHLHRGTDWKEVVGISYRDNQILVNNQLRTLEADLDNFPFPLRSEIKPYFLEKKYTTLLAGRGCVHNCIFCDIRAFYGQPPGPVKRIRNPVKVVEEMEYLHYELDCSVFLFQDDDFPVITHKNSDWIGEFCQALIDKNLSGKIMWKINSRPDEVDPVLFEMMKQHGLFRVFLGIEDGTDSGLLFMNKRLKASDNIKGIHTLKNLSVAIDFGFMLFQPTTTFDSFYDNLNFLELICVDGYMPVTFQKMLPYFETRIEKELKAAGRLIGEPGFLDYNFEDKSLNDFHHFVFDSFNTWLNNPNGFSNIAKWARNDLSVYSFYNETNEGVEWLSDTLNAQISDANIFMLETLRDLSVNFESGHYYQNSLKKLNETRCRIEEKHNAALQNINEIIGKVELFSLTKVFFRV